MSWDQLPHMRLPEIPLFEVIDGIIIQRQPNILAETIDGYQYEVTRCKLTRKDGASMEIAIDQRMMGDEKLWRKEERVGLDTLLEHKAP